MQTSPDEEIYLSLMEDVGDHTGKRGDYRRRYLNYPYPQRLAVLSDVVKLHILRERGDIPQYLELQEQIFALAPDQKRPQDIALLAIMRWLQGQIEVIKPVTSEQEVLVISMAIWGEEYTKRVLEYNFKTLMARGNLPSLAVEKKIILFIQADEAARKTIEAAPITLQMRAIGAHLDFAMIPDEITPKDQEMTYWMLGAGATLALEYAKAFKATFHHSYPDIIYSDNFFSELFRLSKEHKAILAPGMRSDESLMIPELQAYVKEHSISIPSDTLMALHMNCLHIVAWPYLVNNRSSAWVYPNSHVMLWESEDHIYFNSPHLNILWLDYSIIKNLPVRFYMTLDSELDLIIKGDDFYIPRKEDKLYMHELSSPERAAIDDNYAHAVDVALTIWARLKHRDVLKFFIRGMAVAINREIRPIPENVITYEQAKAERKFLYNSFVSLDPYAKLPGERWHKGRVF